MHLGDGVVSQTDFVVRRRDVGLLVGRCKAEHLSVIEVEVRVYCHAARGLELAVEASVQRLELFWRHLLGREAPLGPVVRVDEVLHGCSFGGWSSKNLSDFSGM